MRAEITLPVVSIEVKPHHLFRYPSEWNPQKNGKTKGGYLEGKINLPREKNLRIVLSTHPEYPHNFPETLLSESEKKIHPTLIHVVRKGKGNRRCNEKEAIPSIQHWQQEFVIRDKVVFIRNKISEKDQGRVQIPEEDEMFRIKDDMVLRIGRETSELNMIILIPKTEARAAGGDVSLKKLLGSRISNPEGLKALTEEYSKKKSENLRRVRLRVDVFCLESGLLLGSSISCPISDTASKTHGAMDLHDATPLRSCTRGGRKICMIAEFALAKDVQPRFQLYDVDGKRLHEKEEKMLQQPNPGDVRVLKETIIFITPVQEHVEELYTKRFKIKLVAQRQSDGYVSKNKFDFKYLPHGHYSNCYLCEFNPDNNEEQGTAKLVPPKKVARRGLKKRNMSDNEVPDTKMKKVSPVRERRVLSPQERPTAIVAHPTRITIKKEPRHNEEGLNSSEFPTTSQTTDSAPASNLPSFSVYDLSNKATIRIVTIPVTTASFMTPPTDIKKE